MYFEWFTPNRHVPVPRLTPLLFHQWTGNGHRRRVSHTNCTCFQFNSVDWSNDASYAVNNLADVFFAEECFARLWIVKVNKKNVFVVEWCSVHHSRKFALLKTLRLDGCLAIFFPVLDAMKKLSCAIIVWLMQAEQFYIIHKHLFFLQFSY